MSSILNLEKLRDAEVAADPYPHFVVENALTTESQQSLIEDFPPLSKGGSFNLSDVNPGRQFSELGAALDQPQFRQILGEKFSVDVMDRPMMVTLRGYSRPKDGRIHTDSKTKILTVLLYLNESWTAPTGRLRILRNGNNMDDYTKEISPGPGTLLAFKVTDNCWHGYLPFDGKRQSIQVNFLTDQTANRKHRFFHGLSAKLKNLSH